MDSFLPNSRLKLELTAECPELFTYHTDSLAALSEADYVLVF